MNPEEHVKRLLGVIGRLSGVLKEENRRLAEPGRVSQLKEIVAEKELLSRTYEQQVKVLSDVDTITKVKPELRQRLTEAGTALIDLMEENRLKLEAKMEATKTVFKIIAEAAKEYRAASATYGKTGNVAADPRQTRQAYRPAVSVGVDREL